MFFSVVIPLYNKAKSIGATIQSVLDQSFVNFEIIIVNDGSTDASISIVRGINDPRIVIIDKMNEGVSKTRNVGIKASKGEWIAFLDGDDQWSKDYLNEVYTCIRNYEAVDVVVTGFAKINRKNETIRQTTLKEGVVNDYFYEVNQANEYLFHTSATVVTKAALLRVGMFDERLTHGEDLDLWERLARTCFIVACPKILSFYMIDAENRSNKTTPPLEKTRVYNIQRSKINRKEEQTYYKNAIVKAVVSSIVKLNFERGLKLFRKQRAIVSTADVFVGLAKALKGKINI